MNKFMSSIGLVCLLFGVANAQIISKDGVATDTVTGLMWQDSSTLTNNKEFYENASINCSNLDYSNYSDWRLPNIYELATLIDKDSLGDTSIVSGFKNMPVDTFFSSSGTGSAWVLSSGSGELYLKSTQYAGNYICVRGTNLEFDSVLKLSQNHSINVSTESISILSPESIEYANLVFTTSIDTLKGFLKKYPKSAKYDEIIIKLDKLTYDSATKENTIRAYKSYIKEFPKGINSHEVNKKIDELTYNSASSQNTISAYKEYLKQFPNGEYASSARSNIQYLEEENRFRALLQSKSPQTMYIEAGKQERNGNTSKANKLYEAIIDRFPNSDFAVKASDKLTGAIRTERAESNRRSQSRQECENNKNACLAGCGTYVSGADSHNSAVWSCNDKCKQISCY